MTEVKAVSEGDRGQVVMPAWYLAHGSPMLAIQDVPFTRVLQGLAAGAPRPRAIVVVSAHWLTRGEVRVTAVASPETIHDFGGFDPALYAISYPAPGDPELAQAIVTRLQTASVNARLDPSRGLDHGFKYLVSKKTTRPANGHRPTEA